MRVTTRCKESKATTSIFKRNEIPEQITRDIPNSFSNQRLLSFLVGLEISADFSRFSRLYKTISYVSLRNMFHDFWNFRNNAFNLHAQHAQSPAIFMATYPTLSLMIGPTLCLKLCLMLWRRPARCSIRPLPNTETKALPNALPN